MGECKRLVSKYRAILAAADAWDFTECDWLHAAASSVKTDASLMEAVVLGMPSHQRVCESLARSLAWSPEHQTQVDGLGSSLKSMQSDIDQFPLILSCLVLCDVLLDESSPRKSGGTLESDLHSSLGYVTNKLRFKTTSLPQRLQQKIESLMSKSSKGGTSCSDVAASAPARKAKAKAKVSVPQLKISKKP